MLVKDKRQKAKEEIKDEYRVSSIEIQHTIYAIRKRVDEIPFLASYGETREER